MKSHCCNAEVKVEGSTTKYFVCLECGKACDVENVPEPFLCSIEPDCIFCDKQTTPTVRAFFRCDNNDCDLFMIGLPHDTLILINAKLKQTAMKAFEASRLVDSEENFPFVDILSRFLSFEQYWENKDE